MTAVTVIAPDHPRLLTGIAGACAAAGGNIVDAQIFTTTDGLALDTIFVSRAFERDEDELRRGRRIASNIEKTLRGEVRLAEMTPSKQARDDRHDAFAVEPEVTVDNNLSRRYTVVEVSGLDRPGLLRDLTASLSSLNLNIGSAHIVTFGEKAVELVLRHRLDRPEDHRARRDKRRSNGDCWRTLPTIDGGADRFTVPGALDFWPVSPDIRRKF